MQIIPTQSKTTLIVNGKFPIPRRTNSRDNNPTRYANENIKIKYPATRLGEIFPTKTKFTIMAKIPSNTRTKLNGIKVACAILTAAAVHKALPRFNETVNAFPKLFKIIEKIKYPIIKGIS